MKKAPQARINTLVICTPEGVNFRLVLASPLARFWAWMVDQMCIMAAVTLVGTLLGVLNLISLDFGRAVTVLIFFLLQIGYAMTMEWCWRGQTLGKRLLRLRVVDVHGMPLQPAQVVIRNLLRFVDMLPAMYLLGGITAWVSRLGQRLGDLAANTVVIRSPRTALPNVDQIMAGKFNSLREHPHLVARLRQRVGPEVATAALQAVMRRDELNPADRVTLFADFANWFRQAVEFPPETVEGLADEQYVRNVVDVLFRTQVGRPGEPVPAASSEPLLTR